MSRFVVVPQWQGSGSSRAMQLVDGAAAIAGGLPRASCTPLEVPLEAGESLGSGVRRLSSLVHVREALERELADGSEPTSRRLAACCIGTPGAPPGAARAHGESSAVAAGRCCACCCG